ncbi:hypothetical protein EK904_003537, partial [Melospiza melodia maxima]
GEATLKLAHEELRRWKIG